MDNQHQEYNIAGYKVSGFDLILTMPSGEEIRIHDGIPQVVLGSLILKDKDGHIITKDEIVSRVSVESSDTETLFMGEFLKDASDVKKDNPDDKKVADDDKEKADQKDPLNNIIKENQNLKEQLANKNRQLDLAEKTAGQLSENIEVLARKAATEKMEHKSLSEQLAPDISSFTTVEKSAPVVQKLPEPVPPPSSSSAGQAKNEGKSVEEQKHEPPVPPVPPVVTSVQLSKESDSGAKGDFTTNSLKPVLEGNTAPLAAVTLKINGGTLNTTADQRGHWQLPISNLDKDGMWDFDVQVSASGASYSTTGVLTVDRTPPSVQASLDASTDSGVYSNDNVTNFTKPVLTGVTKPETALNILLGGRMYPVVPEPDGKWAFTVPVPLSDGIWQYTITATDKAGNSNTGTATFRVDTSVSVLTAGLSPEDIMEGTGANVTDSVRPVLRGEVEPGSDVRVLWKGNELRAHVEKDGKWSLALTDNAADGVNEYTVIAHDIAGNERSLQGNFIYSAGGNDSGTLITTIGLSDDTDSGVKGDFITNNQSPVLEGKTAPGATVILMFNGVRQEVIADKNDGSWQVNTEAPLQDGRYEFSVQVSRDDDTGPEQKGHLTIDTALPVAEAELTADTDTGLSHHDNITTAQPVITGVTKPWSAVAIEFEGDNVPVGLQGNPINLTASSSGEWSYTPDVKFSDGTYQYNIAVTDPAGNTTRSPAPFSFTIDNAKPELTAGLAQADMSDDASGQDATHSSHPAITGHVRPGSQVVISMKDDQGKNTGVHNVAVNDEGNWKFIVYDGLHLGKNAYSVEATTLAGKTQKLEKSFDFTPKGNADFALTAGLIPETDSGTKGDNITNAQAVKLGGTTVPGATVSVIINDATYDATVNDKGEWSTSPIKGLPQGTIFYKVIAEHNGQQMVKNSAFVIDRILPTSEFSFNSGTVIYNELSPNSDGRYDSLHYNADNKIIKVSGVTKPGATVAIKGSAWDTDVIHEARANEKGEWSIEWNKRLSNQDDIYGYNWNKWPDDSKNIVYYTTRYTITDVAGNSVSKPLRFYINATTPSLENGEIYFSGERYANKTGMTVYSHELNPVISGKAQKAVRGEVSVGGKKYDFPAGDDGVFSFRIPDGVFSPGQAGSKKLKLTFYTVSDRKWETVDYTLNVLHDPHFGVTGHLDHRNDPGFTEDDKTTDATPVLTGRVSGAGLNAGKVTGTLTVDGGQPVDIGITSGQWQQNLGDYFQTQKLATGEHRYTVEVRDVYGNTAVYYGQFTILPFDITLQGKGDPHDPGYFITNAKQPSLTGKVSDENTVRKVVVYVDGQFDGEVTPAGGRWEYTVTSELLDGTHTVEAQEQGPNLAEGLHTVKQVITVDTLPPEVSVTVPGKESYIRTGTELTGETKPYATVMLEMKPQGGQPTVMKATADSHGQWKATVTLPDGEYDYTVSAVDVAGNTTAEKSVQKGHLYMDSTPPVGLTWGIDEDAQFSDGDFYTEGQSFTLIGHGETGTNVTVLTQDKKQSVTTGIVNGSWSLEIPSAWWPAPLNQKKVPLVLINTDKAGNKTEIKTGFEIVNGENNVTVELAEQGAEPWWTSVQNPTLTGTARAFSSIVLTVSDAAGKSAPYSTMAGQDGHWEITIPTTANQGYTWTLTATDILGHEASAAGSLHVDNTLPALTLEGVAEVMVLMPGSTPDPSSSPVQVGLKSSGRAYYSANKDASWQFHGTTSSSANKVTVKLGGMPEVTATVNEKGEWTADVVSGDGITSGENTYVISVKNNAGSEVQERGSLNVVTQPPETTSTLSFSQGSHTEQGYFTRDDVPVIQGKTAVEANVTVTVIKADGSGAGTSFRLPVTADKSGNWSVELKKDVTGDLLGEGKWTWSVDVTDLAGNQSKSDPGVNTVTIQRTWIDTSSDISPSVEVFSSDGIHILVNSTTEQSPLFRGTAPAGSSVELTLRPLGGQDVVLPRTASNGSGDWSIHATQPLQDGSYTITLKVFDKFGNQKPDVWSSASPSLEIKTSEQVDLGTIAGHDVVPDTGNILINNKQPTFTGQGVSGDDIYLTITDEKGTTVAEARGKVSDGNWSLIPDSLISQDGVYSYTIKATDASSGAEGEIRGNMTLDVTPPSLHAAEVKGSAMKALPEFHGTAEGGATVSITVQGTGGRVHGDVCADPDSGLWSWKAEESDVKKLPDGDYTWEIVATDMAGNQSQASKGTFTLDTTPPGLTETYHDGDQHHYMNDEGFIFEGKSETGSTVYLTITDILGEKRELSTQVGSKDGDWSIHVKDMYSLPDGEYSYSVQAVDKAGNSSATPTTGTFSLKNVTPDMKSFAYDGASHFVSYQGQEGDKLELSVKKHDNHVDVTVLHAESRLTSSAEKWDYNINDLKLNAGQYGVKLTVTDKYNNHGEKELSMSIPDISPVSPLNQAGGHDLLDNHI